MAIPCEFRLPDIGEGVADGEVVAWHVKVGDRVKEDDPMVEVMTDKATVTIGAPKTGVIRELKCAVGQKANVGSVLVVIDTGEASAPGSFVADPSTEVHGAAFVAPGRASAGGPAASAVGDIREGLPGTQYFEKKACTQRPNPASATSPKDRGNGDALYAVPPASAGPADQAAVLRPLATKPSGGRPLATPAVRKAARDMGIDLGVVPATGSEGRVTHADLRAFGATGAVPVSGAQAVVVAAAAHEPVRVERAVREERQPFVGIRRKIAEHLQLSKRTAAHFTFVEECDATRLLELKERLQPAAEAAGTKMTLLPFVVKATVAALKKHPVLNSALDETTNELVFKYHFDIGIASATDQGLMVPVVRDADARSLVELAQEIERLSAGARAGKLSPSDLTGSTFTITSLGKQGGLFATPILNFPEVAILGLHQIKQKPVVRKGQIVIGDVMLVSLSLDHRVVDGHVGAAFAYDLIAYLEEPAVLFLEGR